MGLIGRNRELELIQQFIGQLVKDGAALVLYGEPGVGKTAVLEVTAQLAKAEGVRVLRASGVEFEAGVSFSALNQALLPLIDARNQLAEAHRDALSLALGFEEGPPPARRDVASAALALARTVAAAQPLLLIVDDLPWVDRASASVYGYIARNVAGTRVGFLAATRSDQYGFFERAGLPEEEVMALDEASAERLITDRFPDLAPRVRARLLAEAQGNPLALLELPRSLAATQSVAERQLPAVLPLNRRLQALFASRIADLPPSCRSLLLLAALAGSGDLRIVQAAAGIGSEELDGSEGLGPADRVRLIHLDPSTRRLAFRHPLIRSAIVQLSSAAECRSAHRQLAAAFVGQTERRAWHLAEASTDPDEEVAELLEGTAHDVLTRGDAVGAVTALTRAADLSPRGPDRARRLAEAAYIGADVAGELERVPQLLADGRRADPDQTDSLHNAIAAAFVLLNGDGDIDTAHRLLVGAIEAADASSDRDRWVLGEALHVLLTICWFSAGRTELWDPFYAGVARLAPEPSAPLALCAAIFADPARTTGATLAALDLAVGKLEKENDPTRIVRTGMAAFFVDRMEGCRAAHWRVVRDGREGGAATAAINAMIHLTLDQYLTGDWEEAEALADEGVQLCDVHGYRTLAWPLRYALALIAAARGDYETTRATADEMMQWAVPRGARMVQLYASHALGLAALGRGDFDDAYRYASAVTPAGTLPRHVPLSIWTLMDPVESAARSGRHVEARRHAASIEDAGAASLSPRLALLAGASKALARVDASGLGAFEAALALPGIERWPFDLARVQLAYGERLRRARSAAESREHLAIAVETFVRLGAQPWATRAAAELRATAPTRSRPTTDGAASLTPQEREVALLAAAGLTNKEIGARLLLSHRTVGAHLARTFRKLGISSRAALRDALGS